MNTVKKILLLGSGALKIGEAGEFDYSGSQAIKACKEEGKEVILINPNIATIQTSEGLADKIYFLPVTADIVTRVIEKEKPDGILLSFGGQTALNCGIDLYTSGILRKHNVAILGTPMQAIIDTEDRALFARRLNGIGLKTARGKIVRSVKEGLEWAMELGLPVMLRTGFALGGTGSGVADSLSTLRTLLTNAFATSPQVIIEECLYGWKEIEYEVVRDHNNNCITVCNMENFDPVGIHTGESIVIAPSQTLNDREYYGLRDVAIRAIQELKIVGECNIQYALHPKTGDYRIIEVNARLSRSSALASKATGYPLAYIAAKLALGRTLPELRNSVTQETSAFFEPSLDYVVVKIPRWDLEKYTNVDMHIGSEMKSVGEVMSIARTFKEALQKAVRMLNQGFEGVIHESFLNMKRKDIINRLKKPDAQRLFIITAALYQGMSVKEIYKFTGIDPWFLASLQRITETYNALKKSEALTKNLLRDAKRQGFSDEQLALLKKCTFLDIRNRRKSWNILPCVKQIDTLAAEFPAKTNYMFMTYAGTMADHFGSNRKDTITVLGSGPYSIGTSVEFDWCAVNTVNALRRNDKKTIMINCNPETVSTDYDTADYLYFEELTLERILDIYDLEHSPFILSVGGQIPNNLAPKLDSLDIPILGSAAKTILQAEDRRKFNILLDSLGILQPKWSEANTLEQSVREARRLGFPLIIRPSFVLSGKSMIVVETEKQLRDYLANIEISAKQYKLVMSKFLENATECDFDGVAQNGDLCIYALSEHIEHGGVHSGDATLVLPPLTLGLSLQNKILNQVRSIVKALNISGPFNIQYLIHDGTPYVIECNLRASRSIPFVSKAMKLNFIALATEIAIGKKAHAVELKPVHYVTVKVPQFSFRRLRGADPVLRVEMSSTGEVAAFGRDIYEAYLKAFIATGIHYPEKKTVFLSLGGIKEKVLWLSTAHLLHKMGYKLYATEGTHLFLSQNDIPSEKVGKLHENIHPNYTDLLQNKDIGFAVVLPERFTDTTRTQVEKEQTDGYLMRRMSIDMGVPIFTNSQSSSLFVESMSRYTIKDLDIKSWNEYK